MPFDYDADEEIESIISTAPADSIAPLIDLLIKESWPQIYSICQESDYAVRDGKPDLSRKILSDALRYYGSSWWSLYTSGTPVRWTELCKDAAHQLGVDISAETDAAGIERKILDELTVKAVSNLSDDEFSRFLTNIPQNLIADLSGTFSDSTKGISVSVFINALRSLGFLPYQVLSSVIKATGGALQIGVPFGVYMGASKALSVLLGPIGWAAAGGWAAYDLYKGQGPAYRITIPAVVLVALMRAEQQASHTNHRLLPPPIPRRP